MVYAAHDLEIRGPHSPKEKDLGELLMVLPGELIIF